MLKRLVGYLLPCRHRKTTWPRTDRRGIYVACIDCGARLTYNWREMRIEAEDAGEPTNIIEPAKVL